MKNLITILGFIVGTAFAVVIVWAFLYLCIPNIKDDTDKIFKWGEYKEVVTENKEDEHQTTVVPNTEAQVTFENEFAVITLG